MINWQQQLDAAVVYCNLLGWSVSFVLTEDRADLNDFAIYVNRRRSIKNQFFMLLHEMGHLELYSRPGYDDTFGKYQGQYSTLPYRINILEEEVAAWSIGEEIAKKFKWAIDNDFFRIKARMLSTYCLWVNQRKHPHPRFSKEKTEHPNNGNNIKREQHETSCEKARHGGGNGVVLEIPSVKGI